MLGRLTILALIFSVSLTALAQTGSKKTAKKPVKKTTVTAQPAATPAISEPDPAKKNERPVDPTAPAPTPTDLKKTNRPGDKAQIKIAYPYHYEFAQPAFDISQIIIDHDDNGKGTITFSKRDFDEAYTDPVQLSAETMQRLKTLWDNLSFLDSTENYQAPKDFAHLGTIKLRLKRDGRERTAQFNWTENKDAKGLMDTYRNLGQQYIWIFDINIARENQPLESPKLMDSFESMLKRNEIPDGAQMVPFLNELSNDERMPLLARNHALKIVKLIEKAKK